MNLIRLSIKGLATLTLAAASILSLSPSAHAQDNAAAAFNSWNSAFLVQQSGQAYYANTLHGTTREGSWVQALDIEVAEDAYLRNASAANQKLVSDLCTHFLANENYDWNGDTWNDDIAWMTIAILRGYQITGNTALLNQAKYAWNMAYNRGWTTANGGGGIWENMNDFATHSPTIEKDALSNNPMITAGCMLYEITGDATYLNCCKGIYTWVRGNIFNTTTGVVNEGMRFTITNGTASATGVLVPSDNVYNSGNFVQAANYLYRLTGNIQYYNDAKLAVDHVVNSTSIMSNNGGAQTQWQYRFVKGLSEFATYNSKWSQYRQWMLNNANSAWNYRNSNGLTGNNWLAVNNDSNIEPMETGSAVAVWQLLPPPNASSLLAGKTITLQAWSNGLYVTADNAGANPLIASRPSPFIGAGSWEEFKVVDLGNGNVALQSLANNRYVTDGGGTGQLIASSTSAFAGAGSWEGFQIVTVPNGGFALRAQANDLYVTVSNSSSSPLVASRLAPFPGSGSWETFNIVVR